MTQPSPSLEQILEQIAAQAYWVSNLYQLQQPCEGQLQTIWRANLTRILPTGNKIYNYGDGLTPAGALIAALCCARAEAGTITIRAAPSNYHKGVKFKPTPALAGLSLSDLGL